MIVISWNYIAVYSGHIGTGYFIKTLRVPPQFAVLCLFYCEDEEVIKMPNHRFPVVSLPINTIRASLCRKCILFIYFFFLLYFEHFSSVFTPLKSGPLSPLLHIRVILLSYPS